MVGNNSVRIYVGNGVGSDWFWESDASQESWWSVVVFGGGKRIRKKIFLGGALR
jgi:hypothetical protein